MSRKTCSTPPPSNDIPSLSTPLPHKLPISPISIPRRVESLVIQSEQDQSESIPPVPPNTPNTEYTLEYKLESKELHDKLSLLNRN